MLTDITIGQFFPGDSVLHRMDPRVKILLLFFFLLAIFLWTDGTAYAVFTSLTAALVLSSRISVRLVLRSLKPLWWIILFTFLIHLLGTSGTALFETKWFSITQEGVRQGFFISLRLVLLIVMSSLLTFTTSPLQLTDAIESLLGPFRRFGVPAHELAMMMTIALRFVPTIIEETDRIMKAQQSRGADFTTGSIVARVKSFVPVLVPLFISAFRRADELAMAMEARCYRGGVGRTRMKTLRVTGIDYVACGVSAGLFVVLFLLQGWL